MAAENRAKHHLSLETAVRVFDGLPNRGYEMSVLIPYCEAILLLDGKLDLDKGQGVES